MRPTCRARGGLEPPPRPPATRRRAAARRACSWPMPRVVARSSSAAAGAAARRLLPLAGRVAGGPAGVVPVGARSRARSGRAAPARRRVVGARRQRQRRSGSRALLGAASASPATCARSRASVSPSRSTRPTWSAGAGDSARAGPPSARPRASPRPSAATKRAEVLDELAGSLGQPREPGSSPNSLDEARLAQQQLGLPGRPQARRRVAHEREAQPAVLAQDALALLALVVARSGAPGATG